MRILCCDPYRELFFIAVNKQELEEQILPLHRDLLEEYAHDEWKYLYVTAPWLMEQELKAQAQIKANPFTSKTIDFSRCIHEPCDADAYIVVSKDLMQLYFVPFNYFSPSLWKGDGKWNAIDKRDIKQIAEIADVPFSLDGKQIPTDDPDWTNGDAEALLADYEEKLPEWSKKGPTFVFEMVMSQLRKYHLWPKEAQKLLTEGGCIMPREFWELDYAHLPIQSDYFIEKEPTHEQEKRTIEEEMALLDSLIDHGQDEYYAGMMVFLDYLDDIIDWQSFIELLEQGEQIAKLAPKDEGARKRWIWLEMYKPNNVLSE